MTPSTASAPSPALRAFLEPLRVDQARVVALSHAFAAAFTHLAAESAGQFLPTPISESVLLPINRKNKNQGRYLAIDIGGTNLRVGFVELLGDEGPGPGPGPAASQAENQRPENGPVPELAEHTENANAKKEQSHRPPPPARGADKPCLQRLHERSWPIQDHLKSENADSLFAWIGGCIAAVVREGCASFGLSRDATLPMGVTFSFPMEQNSLSEARLMSMGKGFAITGHLDLGSYLVKGYERARQASAGAHPDTGLLPPIAVAAITNDAVATLVSFVYELSSRPNQKAIMGIICGTGCNATLLLNEAKLHPSKRWVKSGTDTTGQEKIVVNTEWSINGTAPAMRAAGFISRWDDQLSQAVESPGFQPLEYMTAGRYLGELGRIMLVDYMRSVLGIDETALPAKFLRKLEPRNTQFLSHYQVGRPQSFRAMLEAEFPTAQTGPLTEPADSNGHGASATAAPFRWTDEIAEALYHIAKAIEVRAAAIVAAAIVGLLECADELPPSTAAPRAPPFELVVGYTGGCITNFQDYLADCQGFLDGLVAQRYGCAGQDRQAPILSSGPPAAPVRIVLHPCHNGGIKGAGILVPVALASQGAAE